MLVKNYAAYLFDLDGTLVDTAPDIMTALNISLIEAGFTAVNEALTRHWVGHGARRLIEQAILHHKQSQPEAAFVESILKQFLEYYGAHIADRSRPYAGVYEALQSLQKRAALGLVTNKQSGLTLPLLEALNLSRFFEVIVSGDTLDESKPAPGPAIHACKDMGVSVAQTLFVGDSITDVHCARAAGCDIVCVSGGYSHGTPTHDLGADGVIDSLITLV